MNGQDNNGPTLNDSKRMEGSSHYLGDKHDFDVSNKGPSARISKWIVMDTTNATFYIKKLRDHPVGCSTRLSNYVFENPLHTI